MDHGTVNSSPLIRRAAPRWSATIDAPAGPGRPVSRQSRGQDSVSHGAGKREDDAARNPTGRAGRLGLIGGARTFSLEQNPTSPGFSCDPTAPVDSAHNPLSYGAVDRFESSTVASRAIGRGLLGRWGQKLNGVGSAILAFVVAVGVNIKTRPTTGARANRPRPGFPRDAADGTTAGYGRRNFRIQNSTAPLPPSVGAASTVLCRGASRSGSGSPRLAYTEGQVIFGLVLIVMLLVGLMLIAAGCHAAEWGKHLEAAGAATDRISTRTTFIDSQVKQISGHAPQKRTITEQTAFIRTDAGDVQQQLAKLRSDFDAQAKTIHGYEENVWVSVALWCQRICYWLIGIIVVGNILAIIVGVNPLGIMQMLSKEIVRALPLMNVAAWIRDWINKRKLLKAQLTDRLAQMGAAPAGGQ